MPTCDRCGPTVRAQWIVWVGQGLLYLCGHHYRVHALYIAEKGYRSEVIDGQ